MSGSPRRQPGRMGAHIEPFREMDCPTSGCGGWLGPWGYTTRRVRIALGQSEIRRQRRGYCRSCRRSHVLSDLFTYPHRLDTAATVTAALVAAVRSPRSSVSWAWVSPRAFRSVASVVTRRSIAARFVLVIVTS